MLIRLYGDRLLSVCLGKHRSTCQVAENDLLLGRPLGQSPIAIYVPSVSKKYKLANGTPRSFACPIMAPLQWGWFCVEGAVHFMSSSCEQIWKSIRNEHKIIAWSYWLYVYAEWLSKYNLRMRSGGGGRCLQGNLWYSPPASMKWRLASVTFKMASKVFTEETDKNFDFITKIPFRFLGFGDFKVSFVIEN